jgi:hypothetical protein
MSLWFAVIAVLALGGAATAYLWNIRRHHDATAAGIAALSAMRWREFSHFVLDAMRHRGYDVITPEDEAERGQQSEFLLRRGGERLLLSCKHGSAYRLKRDAVAELASSQRFQGASGGFLVTPGRFDADARKPAREANIELVDGSSLWPEVSPLLPHSLTDEVQRVANATAKRKIAFTWVAAIAIGIVMALLALMREPAPASAPAVGEVSVPAQSSAPTPVVATPPAPVVATEPDIAAEDRMRAESAELVSTIPGIERALWTTRSTLLVNLEDGRVDRFTEICAVLKRYDVLRTARVHLQPPPGGEGRVRFLQCQTY